MEDCLHLGYHEEAGGFLICDECGEDVTILWLDADDPEFADDDDDAERDFDWNDVAEEKELE